MERTKVSFINSFACAVLAALSLSAAAQTPAIQSLHFTSKDGPRHFLLVVPSHFDKAAAVPLVLVLHGHMGTAAGALGQVGRGSSPLAVWVQIAEREGILVAALDGAIGPDGKTGWNDCRADKKARAEVDDVAFANAVAAELIAGISATKDSPATPRADPHRIYVMGMSNGGVLTFRLAEQMQPRPAAIVSVAASLPAPSDDACSPPTHALPVLLIEGTADPIMPYAGGEIGSFGSRGLMLGAERTAAVYAALAATKPTTAKPEPVKALSTIAQAHAAADTTTEDLLTYTPPNSPFPVELLRINGGGHAEPSITHHYSAFYSSVAGTQNSSIEAAEFAWNFMRSHHN